MTEVGGIAADQLRSYIERVERLQAEIDDLNADKKDVFAEARGTGFDVPTIKKIIKERKLDPDSLSEQEHLLALYRMAVGTPIAFARAPAQEAAE